MVGGIKAMTLRMFGKVSNLQHIEVPGKNKSFKPTAYGGTREKISFNK